jgi:ribosomal subunit interface protein
MLEKFEISGVHADIDPSMHKYVTKMIGGLEKYIPSHSRKSAHVEVHLKESKAKDKNSCMCEVTIHLPGQIIIVKESALNMYAAVDIAEAKLKIQLKKYKDMHANGKSRRHLMARFLRKST